MRGLSPTLFRNAALFQCSVELIRAAYLGLMVYHYQIAITEALPVFFFQALVCIAAYGVYRAEPVCLAFSATIAFWRLVTSVATYAHRIPVVFIDTDILLDPAQAKYMYLIGLGTTVLPAFILSVLFFSSFLHRWRQHQTFRIAPSDADINQPTHPPPRTQH